MGFEYIFRNVRTASGNKTSAAYSALSQEKIDIYVLEPQEVLAVYFDMQIQTGKLSREQADKLMRGSVDKAPPKQKKALTDYLFNTVTSYGVGNVSSWQSAHTLQKMVREFGGLGEIVIKEVQGKTYVIFKGYAGLRKTITGTRYLITHPKVVEMGIGKLGQRTVIQSGVRITFIAMLGYRVLEFLLVDEVTLGKLIANLATDVVKIAAGIGISALLMTAAGVTMTTIALGPLVAVVLAGFVVSAGLEYLDAEFGITEKMATLIDGMLHDIAQQVANTRDVAGRKLKHVAYSWLDMAVEHLIRTGKTYIRRRVDYFLGPR